MEGDTPVQKMGMNINMETDDFEAAADFISKFGDFVKDHAPNMQVTIDGAPIQPERPERQEVGASQPSLNGNSVASAVASINEEVTMHPIDTPSFDIATDPGRFAFEEEG